MGHEPAVATFGIASRHLWALVLADGEAVGRSPRPRTVGGDIRRGRDTARPSRPVLGETLEGIARLIPRERTVVVTAQGRARYLAGELTEWPGPQVLVQPSDRGTAAGVLFPAHWIHAQDPQATMVVFSSCAFVNGEASFMGHVAEMAAFVGQSPDRIVLLGAQPTDSVTERSWIEAGERVGWTAKAPIYRVRRFEEKPSREVALVLLSKGCLWNTFVFVAQAAALIEAGRECAPTLHERLARIPAFMGTELERWAIRHAYALAPTLSFSRAILAGCGDRLAVSRLPGLMWYDLPSPEHVVSTR